MVILMDCLLVLKANASHVFCRSLDCYWSVADKLCVFFGYFSTTSREAVLFTWSPLLQAETDEDYRELRSTSPWSFPVSASQHSQALSIVQQRILAACLVYVAGFSSEKLRVQFFHQKIELQLFCNFLCASAYAPSWLRSQGKNPLAAGYCWQRQ